MTGKEEWIVESHENCIFSVAFEVTLLKFNLMKLDFTANGVAEFVPKFFNFERRFPVVDFENLYILFNT